MTYDSSVGAAHIYFAEEPRLGYCVAKTVPLDPLAAGGMVNVDMDAEGRLTLSKSSPPGASCRRKSWLPSNNSPDLLRHEVPLPLTNGKRHSPLVLRESNRRPRVLVGVVFFSLAGVGLSACGEHGSAIMDVQVSRDDTELGIGIGDCKGDHRAEVEETDEAVRVRVVTENRLEIGENRLACMDTLQVELSQPLGDRDVLDATTGETVDIERPSRL